MKILRYLIFLSILNGIFFVIYRQSDKKGFRRWWISFKIAVLIAASLAGLVSESAEAQEFNWYENTNQQVILVGRDSSGTSSNVPSNIGRQGQSPSNFPTPPSGGRPSPTATGVKPYTYRQTPKVVDQGLGAGANPVGGGNGGEASWDDQCPVPKKEQSQESKTFDYPSNYPQKKKKSKDQCELDENVKDEKIEIVYRIKENPALVREAERKDQAVQKDVNNLIEQLSLGNDNPVIGNRRVKGLKNVSKARGRNEGSIYFREKNGKIEILAKSNKDNQNKVIGILQKMGY